MTINVEGWYRRGFHGTFDFITVEVYDTEIGPPTHYGDKIGFMQGWLYSDGTAEIALVELDSPYHGQGIGKRMYREFIDTAFRAGAKRIRSSDKPSEQAQHVWMSLDKENPEKVKRIGPVQWEVVRRRPIRAHRRSR